MRREEWSGVQVLLGQYWPPLIGRLAYDPQDDPRKGAVGRAYWRMLKTFTVAALEAGLETMFQNRTDRRPPAPAELRAVVATLVGRNAARFREVQPKAMLKIALQIEGGLIDRARHREGGFTRVVHDHSVMRDVSGMATLSSEIEEHGRAKAVEMANSRQPVESFVLYARTAPPGYEPGAEVVSWRDWEDWEWLANERPTSASRG